MKNAIIIGGGLAGLISAIQLAMRGVPCVLIEKKSYPLHRVCGEYISNEAVPFLKARGLYPEEFDPPHINRLQLSSVTGKNATISLDLGGFGISRFSFDNFLYNKAKNAGVEFCLNTEVEKVRFVDEKFTIETQVKTFTADLVIGAFGKRSKLDIFLNRKFIKKRSPFTGIKYHIKTDHPHNLIALHNFEGGYCGISNVENSKTNLCYLTHRDILRKCGGIKALETEVLFKNPLLKSIFTTSDFIFDKPEVVNEISFDAKAPVENHMLMAGDAAGMIAPLCGNGMAMAMHAGKLVSELAIAYCEEKIPRTVLEKRYTYEWRKRFSRRLWVGRQIQKFFGNEMLSNALVNLALHYNPITKMLVRNTHGQVF